MTRSRRSGARALAASKRETSVLVVPARSFLIDRVPPRVPSTVVLASRPDRGHDLSNIYRVERVLFRSVGGQAE